MYSPVAFLIRLLMIAISASIGTVLLEHKAWGFGFIFMLFTAMLIITNFYLYITKEKQ